MLFAILFSSLLHASDQPKIFGGEPVQASDPISKTTVLIVGQEPRRNFLCSGSIISETLILTAAHCLGTFEQAALTVHFKLRQKDPGPVIKVVKHIGHTDFNSNTDDLPHHDLAVLKLASPIPAGYYPIKIFDSEIQNNAVVTLAGYGRDNAQVIGNLNKTDQVVINAHLNEKEFLVDIHGHGSCFGDSGGPALVQVNNQYYIAGITSRLTARDYTGPNVYQCIVDMIYENLSQYTDWLEYAAQKLN